MPSPRSVKPGGLKTTRLTEDFLFILICKNKTIKRTKMAINHVEKMLERAETNRRIKKRAQSLRGEIEKTWARSAIVTEHEKNAFDHFEQQINDDIEVLHAEIAGLRRQFFETPIKERRERKNSALIQQIKEILRKAPPRMRALNRSIKAIPRRRSYQKKLLIWQAMKTTRLIGYFKDEFAGGYATRLTAEQEEMLNIEETEIYGNLLELESEIRISIRELTTTSTDLEFTGLAKSERESLEFDVQEYQRRLRAINYEIGTIIRLRKNAIKILERVSKRVNMLLTRFRKNLARTKKK